MNNRLIMTKAKKHQRAGDNSLWKLCFLARYIIESSSRGDTEGNVLEFANAIKRTNRTVYNMCAAATAYKGLYKPFLQLVANFPGRHYSELRQLPYKHFLIIGRLTIRFDLPPIDTLHYLFDALDNGYSAERLERDIVAENNGGEDNDTRVDNGIERRTNFALNMLEDVSAEEPESEVCQAISLAVDTVRGVAESIGKNRPVWYPIALTIRSSALALSQRDDIPDKLSGVLSALSDAIEQIFEELGV